MKDDDFCLKSFYFTNTTMFVARMTANKRKTSTSGGGESSSSSTTMIKTTATTVQTADGFGYTVHEVDEREVAAEEEADLTATLATVRSER